MTRLPCASIAAPIASLCAALCAAAAAHATPATPTPAPQTQSRPSAADLFVRLDADSDGFIRASDITTLREQAFDRADVDANGFVDATEGEALRDLAEGAAGGRGLRRRNPEAQGPGLSRYDTDGDGQVSRAEWTGREIGVLRLDTDGDGAVSEAEFAAVQGRRRGGWR